MNEYTTTQSNPIFSKALVVASRGLSVERNLHWLYDELHVKRSIMSNASWQFYRIRHFILVMLLLKLEHTVLNAHLLVLQKRPDYLEVRWNETEVGVPRRQLV
jgi:hypothetical protein